MLIEIYKSIPLENDLQNCVLADLLFFQMDRSLHFLYFSTMSVFLQRWFTAMVI